MKKLLIAMIAGVAGAAAFAAANDVVLTFSSKGPDKYADGSVVRDGECYALVWQPAGATGAATAAAATAVPADAPKPTIKGIRVADGYVYVTVANTAPYLQYNLAAGTDPANLGEAKAAETPVNGKSGEDIILVAPAKSEGGFFRVGRN